MSEEIEMIDLGEWDARKTVPQSGSEHDPVFDQFREKLQGLTAADWDAILESNVKGAKDANSRSVQTGSPYP